MQNRRRRRQAGGRQGAAAGGLTPAQPLLLAHPLLPSLLPLFPYADYTSIQPATYTVTLAYTISGEKVDPTPCTDSNGNSSPCLPLVG